MKYLPFIYLDIKSNRRLILLFEMIFFPILSVAGLGLFSVFTKIPFDVKMFLFTGMMGWTIVYLTQYILARGFMSSIWFNTLKQTFTSPVDLRDMIIGHSIYGLIASTIGFLFLSLFTLIFFHFNIFVLGVYLPLIILLGSVCGMIIGVIAVSFVVLFGLKVDIIIWTLIDIIVFISGLYYSISVFPSAVQMISRFFPIVYVFEAIRGGIVGQFPLLTLAKGYLVGIVWLIICLILIKRIDIHAKKTGFYEKYG